MSAKHEWLNLVEVSGPFLAVPVLREVFPQGLDELETARARRLRGAYEEWREAVDGEDTALEALHLAWIEEVFHTALDVDQSMLKRAAEVPSRATSDHPEHDHRIVPDIVIVDPTHGDDVLCPAHVFPPDTDLDASKRFGGLMCSPADRMALHLRALGKPFGLVTNGERWMLVHAPVGQVSGFASWYARLWGQEPETLRAFCSLLGARRFFALEDERLTALYERSLAHQDEVTDALGEQVRRAVEVLIQALDRADQDRNRELLRDVEPKTLYEAGLTVMMRLVFLLAAEERGLLLLGEPRYDSFYAISTLRMQLRPESDEILERRRSAWSRLLAVFRAVYGGVEHPTLRLPALGGSLFDPDRFPFLEGRKKATSWRSHRAEPLPIDDRTVLLLLDAIQKFEGRTLSYRALDVEQIGHVYEGLLERTVERVGGVTLELKGTKSAKEPQVQLGELESAQLDGEKAVISLLRDRTKRSKSALTKKLGQEVDGKLGARLLAACRGDVELRDRLQPYAQLLRTDPWGYPLVYPTGAFAVVLGADRRETGTHYTPKSLTEKIVEETLTPLVYEGPATGAPRAEWKLKSAAELLDLKVCDPAMGSGAFLVQACRFLAARLVESWALSESNGGHVDIDGRVHESRDKIEPLPAGEEARVEHARRLVVERCLYGVDLNPLAVELAKLSLWLVTLSKGRPFGFLDHNLRPGDSLLGIHRLDQLTKLSMSPDAKTQERLFGKNVRQAIDEAMAMREQLRAVAIRDIRDVQKMADLDEAAHSKLAVATGMADAFIGLVFVTENVRDEEPRLAALSAAAESAVGGLAAALDDMRQRAAIDLSKGTSSAHPMQPFHWPLQFPEVFLQASNGFDAVIGNPPMLGGRRISFRHSDALLAYLKQWLNGAAGTTDLCVYFLLRASHIVRRPGFLGLVLSDIVAQGESRINGLQRLIEEGFTVYSCVPSRKWPGAAGVKIAHVHTTNCDWHGIHTLNEEEVAGSINSFLQAESAANIGSPFKLIENDGLSFSGHYLMGQGFVVSDDEASRLQSANPRSEEVLFPLIRGDDINNSVDQTSGNYAINFSMRALAECEQTYPECLEIVRKNVKPERDLVKRKANRERWWRYAEARPGLESATRDLDRVIVLPFTAKYIFPTFVAARSVFAHPLVVVAQPSFALYGCLQSSVHELWVWQFCSTSLDLLRYTKTTVLSTFPFPPTTTDLQRIGRDYYAYRQQLIKNRGLGLTDIYNLFHSESDASPDIQRLRVLHGELNTTVIAAYGWTDISTSHGFFPAGRLPTSKNLRFTLSEDARSELLRRLCKLNHKRHAEEAVSVKKGKKHGTKRKSKAQDGQLDLENLNHDGSDT